MNKYYEKDLTSGNITSYYYLGGRLVAMKQGSANVTYVHQDSLGGTSVVSDSSGSLVNSIAYTPFGLTRSGSVSTDIKFTGQRLDDTGLYYYGARYYDPAIGRFISADTAGQHLTNPQTLNRYSYVVNNPLRYTDPTGREWVEDYWGNGWWDDTEPGQPYDPHDNPAFNRWEDSQPSDPTPEPDLPLEPPAPGGAGSPGPTIPTDPPQPKIPQPVAPARVRSDVYDSENSDTGKRVGEAASATGNIFLGAVMIQSGIIFIGFAVGEVVVGAIGGTGFGVVPALAVAVPQGLAGYDILSGGIERVSFGHLKLPDIPILPW